MTSVGFAQSINLYGLRACCYGLALLALLFQGCQEREGEAAPSEEELAIFSEIVLIEAVLQDFSGPMKDSLTQRYYGQLYDRFGIDAVYLDQLRDRYDGEVVLWKTMTDSVEARLDREQANPANTLRNLAE